MDFLKKLHTTAQLVAREGLEKLGVSIPPVRASEPSYDIFETYRRLVEKNAAPEPEVTVIPLPETIRAEIWDLACELASGNEEVVQQINLWAADRKTLHPALESDECTIEMAKRELFEILSSFSLVQPRGDDAESWILSAQKVASAQKRPVSNLIYQAAQQFDADVFSVWLEEMNMRLERFHLAIVELDGELISIRTR